MDRERRNDQTLFMKQSRGGQVRLTNDVGHVEGGGLIALDVRERAARNQQGNQYTNKGRTPVAAATTAAKVGARSRHDRDGHRSITLDREDGARGVDAKEGQIP